MSFRTVVIGNRAKLDESMGYLVCRGEKETRVHISEISVLIVESTAVAITAALLCELVKRKVKVIFCDEKHMPLSQLVGFCNSYRGAGQVMSQTRWTKEAKERVWKAIIEKKIFGQAEHMRRRNVEGWETLYEYANDVLPGDRTNREGLAAKLYFGRLFGEGRRCETFYNGALNYGYAILLSIFSRELSAHGCALQLGIWHCNEFNQYNLASDLMEPFRVIVDDLALGMEENDPDMKRKMQNVANVQVQIAGKRFYLDNGIAVYVRSFLNAMSGDGIPEFWENYYIGEED